MKVKKIIRNSEYTDTFDLETEDTHSYQIHTGLVTHNSSVVSGATNGVEPPRSFLQVKSSKSGIIKLLVPEYTKLRNHYELLWEMPTMEGYLKINAIIQKFIDQAISINTSYNPMFYDGSEIPLDVLVKDILFAYRNGHVNLYYQNTYDMNEVESDGCESGACKV